MSKNESFKKTGSSYNQKSVYLDNPGENAWKKIENSSKTG